jgi:hypothetical protein
LILILAARTKAARRQLLADITHGSLKSVDFNAFCMVSRVYVRPPAQPAATSILPASCLYGNVHEGISLNLQIPPPEAGEATA